MRINNFRNCCGTVEFGEFLTDAEATKRTMRTAIEDFIVEADETSRNVLMRSENWRVNLANALESYTVMIATVNNEQKAAKSVLEGLGFKAIEPEGFVNPKTNNIVWVLVAKVYDIIRTCQAAKAERLAKPVAPGKPHKRVL